jgi:diguanylate cyclase (GGDEF)-like protein
VGWETELGMTDVDPPKVLIVDDDQVVTSALKRSLRQHFGVTGFTRASEAIERLQGDREFAVVVADLAMPDMDGLEFLTRAKEIAPDTVRILLSGHLSVDSTMEAVNRVGIYRCLTKPWSTEGLIDSLHNAVLQHEVNLQNRRAGRDMQIERALSLASDPILILDESGTSLFHNASAAAFFGIDRDVLENHCLGIPVAADDENQLLESVSGRIAEMRTTKIRWHGTSCWLLILRDVTEQLKTTEALNEAKKQLEEANRELYRSSVSDPLTGFLNRRGLQTKLLEEVARCRRYGANLTAVLIDCDEFKSINSRYGHAGGDAALMQISERIKKSTRETDVIARIGGDEFLVLLPETRLAEGVVVAEKVRQAVSETEVETAMGSLYVSVSAGVAGIPLRTCSLGGILQLLEEALSHSKIAGRNRVVSAEQKELGVLTTDRLFEEGFLELFVQPVIDLSNSNVFGYECYCRGSIAGLESATQIFRFARESGVLTDLDIRCLGLTMKKVADLRPRHYHCNVFPTTLLDSRSAELKKLMSEVPDATFCLELSEQEFVGEVHAIRDSLLDMRNRGVYLALKDTGFGGRTLEAILSLEPDLIRVSREFMGGFADAHIRRRTWSRLLNVARAIGARVVAEGIEVKEDAEMLEDLGVHYGQGYYFGKPEKIG